jgi:hypothetical protein
MLEYLTMKPDPPYLNPQDNPASVLQRLLQQLPPSRTQFKYNEAQLCEEICFHVPVQQIVRTYVATLQLMFQPVNDGYPARQSTVLNISVLLQQEADTNRAPTQPPTYTRAFGHAQPHQHPRSMHAVRITRMRPTPLGSGSATSIGLLPLAR